MKAATWPRGDRLADRLLVVDRETASLADRTVRDLPDVLRTGDLLIVNDSATLPASLFGEGPAGEPVELRLVGMAPSGAAGSGSNRSSPEHRGGLSGSEPDPSARWTGVLFGAGDHRTRTEDRPAPPRVGPGQSLHFGQGLSASIEEVSALSPRLVTARFSASGAALFSAIYRIGRPIQYSYVQRPLPLWHVQTPYSARPWSVEQPSAGRSLTLALLARLRDRGVEIATVTHAAGLSATGDPAIDARLPLPERYDIPARTVAAVARTSAAGGRIVAVGTSVVRALEGSFMEHASLVPGSGITDLRLGPETKLHVVTDLLTGIHDPGTSHFDLLTAFAPPGIIAAAHTRAEATGYLGHELGDFALYVH